MIQFENFLLDKGYIKHILNCKTMKYEVANGHEISTMTNIDHRYFHKSDENILHKIEIGKSVMDKDFTWEDRKGEISIGLHEAGKPITLISPRPRIKGFENKTPDDNMNIALIQFTNEEIFKAMYDRSICLQIDLTQNND